MNWYKNLKIKAKLLLGFILVTVLTIVIGILGIVNIKTIDNADTMLFHDGVEAVNYSGNINLHFAQVRSTARSIIIDPDLDKKRGYKQQIEDKHNELLEAGKQLMELVKEYPQRKQMLEDT